MYIDRYLDDLLGRGWRLDSGGCGVSMARTGRGGHGLHGSSAQVRLAFEPFYCTRGRSTCARNATTSRISSYSENRGSQRSGSYFMVSYAWLSEDHLRASYQ